MRQRVAIAIALLHHPDLLIADEPTTALDVTIQAQILAEVQKLAATYGTALIWITHDLSVIAGLADEIAVMYAGRIVETGAAEAVLDRPLHPYTHGLIGSVPSRNLRGEKLRQIPGMTPSLLDLPPGCAFRTRCAHADAACEQEPEPIAAGARADHPLLSSAGRRSRHDTTPIIELRGVSKRFGPTYDAAARVARFAVTPASAPHRRNEIVQAVDNVDLAVERGEVVGLVGESGCGKSTLGRMVAGIMPPSDGEVLFKGHDIATLPPKQARDAKLKVQMIFQDPYASLNPRLRVADIVGEAPLVHGLVSRGELRCVSRCAASTAPASIRRIKRRYPHQFSGGQRQRIGIARALAVQPEFLVCDEAVAALDVSIQAQILNLFMDLRARARPDLPVHQPRPRRGGASVRSRADHVSRPHRGKRAGRGSVRAPQPSLHAGAACRSSAHRITQAAVHRHQGRDPQPARAALRLPLPSALPARHAALQSRKRRACAKSPPATAAPAT